MSTYYTDFSETLYCIKNREPLFAHAQICRDVVVLQTCGGSLSNYPKSLECLSACMILVFLVIKALNQDLLLTHFFGYQVRTDLITPIIVASSPGHSQLFNVAR